MTGNPWSWASTASEIPPPLADTLAVNMAAMSSQHDEQLREATRVIVDLADIDRQVVGVDEPMLFGGD